MSSLHLMHQLADELHRLGIVAVVPTPDDDISPELSRRQIDSRKAAASRRYMQLIQNRSTAAVLVVNPDRYDQLDYIGPNTFGEIAVAFASGRAIYIYQGMPQMYEEELRAWGSIELNGDITSLVHALAAPQSPHFELELALY
jgi:hypothetical protein